MVLLFYTFQNYEIYLLTEKYPSIGGYVYCVGNPIKHIDWWKTFKPQIKCSCSSINSSFNVFEPTFSVFEPPFNVFEPTFNVFERRFLLGSKTFLFSISNKKWWESLEFSPKDLTFVPDFNFQLKWMPYE